MPFINKILLSVCQPAVAALAILAIAAIEFYALSQGNNGSALTAALAAVGTLEGAAFARMTDTASRWGALLVTV
jgi:hypothetical protein